MSNLIKAVFAAWVFASITFAFPAVASATEANQPTIFKAVVTGSAVIEGLRAGLLGGPLQTIEVKGGGSVGAWGDVIRGKGADEFQPTHLVPWGCRTVEDIIDVASPVKSEFRQLLQEKVNLRRCFFVPSGIPIQRLEKMTHIPAEGGRPVMVIWAMRDVNGEIAYGSWPPE